LKHEIGREEGHASTSGTHDPSGILANIRLFLLLPPHQDPPILMTDLLFLISSPSHYLPRIREREKEREREKTVVREGC